MKILHVIPAVAPRYGGPSGAIFDMCRTLKEHGVEPLVVTTDADGLARLPVELGRPLTYKDVPTIFFARQWSESFKYSRPLARWLEAEVARFDLVHIHAVFSHSSLAAARACRRNGVPYVVRPLGSLDPWSLQQKRFRKLLLWHLGVKRMLEGAAAVHYTTDEERRLAESTLRLKRGKVVPLAVDGERLHAQVSPGLFRQRFPSVGENPYVLILCRLHLKKGLELFLEAFVALNQRRDFQHWRLVIVGEGETSYQASLQRLVRQLGGDGSVLFAGWLEGEIKVSALQGAELLALPSHQENFSLSVVEALACGVPVLLSPHVNLAQEILAARAGWVAPLERDVLESVLAEALREDAERLARGAAGKSLVLCRFTWPAVAEELIQLYRSIVKPLCCSGSDVRVLL